MHRSSTDTGRALGWLPHRTRETEASLATAKLEGGPGLQDPVVEETEHGLRDPEGTERDISAGQTIRGRVWQAEGTVWGQV